MSNKNVGVGRNILDFMPSQVLSIPNIMSSSEEVGGAGLVGVGDTIQETLAKSIASKKAGRPVDITGPTPRPAIPSRYGSTYDEIASLPAITAQRAMQKSSAVPRGMSDRKSLASASTEQTAPVSRRAEILKNLYADPLSAKGRALQAAAATGYSFQATKTAH